MLQIIAGQFFLSQKTVLCIRSFLETHLLKIIHILQLQFLLSQCTTRCNKKYLSDILLDFIFHQCDRINYLIHLIILQQIQQKFTVSHYVHSYCSKYIKTLIWCERGFFTSLSLAIEILFKQVCAHKLIMGLILLFEFMHFMSELIFILQQHEKEQRRGPGVLAVMTNCYWNPMLLCFNEIKVAKVGTMPLRRLYKLFSSNLQIVIYR